MPVAEDLTEQTLAEQRKWVDLRLTEIRKQIDALQNEERHLAEKQQRYTRVVSERFHELLYRYVGFERFDRSQAYLLPHKTYVAQSGKYILLGFGDQAQSDEFFEAALKVIS